MMHSPLAQKHFMVGVDLHDSLILVPTPAGPVPTPVPAQPHVVFAFLRWGPFGLLGCAQENPTVRGDWGNLVSRTHDTGAPTVPHWPITPPFYDLLVLLWIATAASKSEWGAHKVKLPKGSAAVALFGFVNPNLNCNGATAPPWFNGWVIAPSTVKCGMTWGDVIAGLVAGIVDAAIQFALNKAFAQVDLSKLKLLAQLAMNVLLSLIATFGWGSPLGYSPAYTPIGGGLGGLLGKGHDALQQGIDSVLGEDSPPSQAASSYYNNPAVPAFPASAAAAPAGGGPQGQGA